MLSKNQIAALVEEKTGVKTNLTKRVMDALGDIATDEVKAGNDFSLPGVARVSFRYTKPYKKGDKYTDVFSKEEKVRENSRKAAIKVAATPAPALKRIVKSMSMSSKAAKAVVERKS